MKKAWLGRIALVLLVVGLLLVGSLPEVRAVLTAERLQQAVVEAGVWGFVVFVVCFTVGQLLQVPGVVFVLAARAAWGPVLGFTNAYVGALVAAGVGFLLVRTLGGQPLGDVTWGPARRILAGLERRPVLTIASLRAVMLLSPPLNYALALSPVRQHHHLMGSALGLVVPVAAVVFLSESALALFRSLS
ncbi:MAG: VTT domain-containing protein [Myxococcus sp.]|nr:VTT domain-containing protein [Myxococcus sp.]